MPVRTDLCCLYPLVPSADRSLRTPGSMEYTGIAPFAILIFLSLFSSPWVRQLCYELFVHSHIAAAIAYLGTMFWHAGNLIDSWIYLWATVAIWVVQLAARAWDKTAMFEVWKKRRDGTAQVMVLDDELGQAAMLRITIQLSLDWTPGQHAFLRFPRLALLDNHPFTITSVPKSLSVKEGAEDEINELVFLVRPYNGITKRLLQHAERNSGADSQEEDSRTSSPHLRIKATDTHRIKLDGPYGGLEQHRAMHKLYDHIILVAGGGGISAMLPWVISLSRQIANLDEPCRVQRVNLIWCIRHASALSWVEEELNECLRLAGSSLQIDVHVTNDNGARDSNIKQTPSEASSGDKEPKDLEINVTPRDKEASSDGASSIHVHTGRPYLPSLLPSLVSLRRTMILGCGPESLKIDLSNTAAKLQSRVLDNSADEVVLHTETFGW